MLKNSIYILLFVMGFSFLFAFNRSDVEDQLGTIPEKKVTVLKLQKTVIAKSIGAYGEIVDEDQVSLSLEMGGRLQSVNVVEGQTVKKGTVLAALGTEEQINGQQQLALEKERAAIALNSLLLEQTELKETLESTERLYNDDAATLEQKEQIEHQLKLLDNQIRIAEQNEKSIEAKINLTEVQTAKFALVAPEDGWIQQLFVKTYETVGAGQPLLLFSPRDQNASLRLQLSGQEVAQLKKGQKALVQLEVPEAVELTGLVRSVSRVTSARKKDYTVIVDFNHKGYDLVYGVLAKAEIFTGQNTTGFKIPIDAVQSTEGDEVSILTLDTEKVIQKQDLVFKEVTADYLLADSDVAEELHLIIEKPIDAKESDKIQLVDYKN